MAKPGGTQFVKPVNHSHLNRGHQTYNNRHDASTTHLITSRAEEHKSLGPRKKSDIYQLSTNNVQHPGIPSSKLGEVFCLTTYTTLEKTRCSIGSGHCVDCGGIVLQSAKTPGTDKEKSVTHLYPQGPITLSRLNFRNFKAELNRNGKRDFSLLIGCWQ